MSDSNKALTKLKQFLWPKDPQKKATVKRHLKSIGLFVVSTFVLVKYGRGVADQIYNRSLIEETIRASLS